MPSFAPNEAGLTIAAHRVALSFWPDPTAHLGASKLTLDDAKAALNLGTHTGLVLVGLA